MKSNRVKKILIITASTLLGLLVVFMMKSYLADSRFKLSFMVKPEVSGHYKAIVLYTDELRNEVNWNKKENIVTIDDVYLDKNSYATLRFANLNRPDHKLNKFSLVLQFKGNIPNGSKISVKNSKVNRSPVENLFITSDKPGQTIIERCLEDKCKTKVSEEFILTTMQNKASLYQHSDLKISASSVNFLSKSSLIVLIISSCFFYCFIRFLLNQKLVQSAKISDLIFVLAISVTALIPLFYIDTRPNIPEPNENRMLSNYVPLLTNNWRHPVNMQWTKQFESYFNDRFGLRNILVKFSKGLKIHLNYLVAVPNQAICQKENSWCFVTTWGYGKYGLELGGFFEPPEKYINVEYIRKIASSTEKNVYLLVYPIKTEVYPEKVLFLKNAKYKFSWSEYAEKQLNTINLPNVHVINLLPSFLAEKQKNPDKLLYYKDEHHATEYANKVVMDYLNSHVPEFAKQNKELDIEKHYPSENLQIASGEFILDKKIIGRFNYGQTWGMVFGFENRNKHMFTIPHKYEFYSFSDSYKKHISFIGDPKCDANILLHNSIHGPFKVMVLGHSFVETLSKVMATSASEVFRRRVNSLCGPVSLKSQNVINQIKELNPDILVIPYYWDTFTHVK